MNKGLTNSIGWNLGKKIGSIHLWEPLTSTPTKGTNIKINNETKNKIDNSLIKLSFSWIEITKRKNKATKTKTKCLAKKSMFLYSFFQQQLKM